MGLYLRLTIGKINSGNVTGLSGWRQPRPCTQFYVRRLFDETSNLKAHVSKVRACRFLQTGCA